MTETVKSSLTNIPIIIYKYMGEYNQTPDNQLFCKICENIVNSNKMFLLKTIVIRTNKTYKGSK